MAPTPRLSVRITLIVVVGALVVAAGVATMLANTVHLRSSAATAVATDRYLLRTVQVERLVVDAETGLRGYLVTGEPAFLSPLDTARSELVQASVALRQSAREMGVFGAQAEALITASHDYLTGYVAAELGRSLRSARSVAFTEVGKTAVDHVRTLSAALQGAIASRQAARQAAARSSANQSIAEGIVLLVLLTVLTLVVGAFLGRLAVSRDRARQLAEETVVTMQRSILPARLPDIPECEIAVRFLPAAGALVSGDFYDVFELEAGRWGIVIGDVCGKGAGAASMSAMTRWTLRSLAGPGVGPAQTLRALNAAMVGQQLDARFVTVSLMILTLDGGRAHVSIASAGHPPPVHVPASAAPAAVSVRGDVLGVWPELRLEETELALAPGDMLVAFTDGVTDQGPDTGDPPEVALGRRPRAAGVEEMADAIVEFARAPGLQRDDIAILALRFTGPGAGTGGLGGQSLGVGTTFTSTGSDVDIAAPVLV